MWAPGHRSRTMSRQNLSLLPEAGRSSKRAGCETAKKSSHKEAQKAQKRLLIFCASCAFLRLVFLRVGELCVEFSVMLDLATLFPSSWAVCVRSNIVGMIRRVSPLLKVRNCRYAAVLES